MASKNPSANGVRVKSPGMYRIGPRRVGSVKLEIDAIELSISVQKQRRQNVAVDLRAGIEDSCRAIRVGENGRDGCQVVPVFLVAAMQGYVQSLATLSRGIPFGAAFQSAVQRCVVRELSRACQLRIWFSSRTDRQVWPQ